MSSGFVNHGYKWVHPACGHEVPLTGDQRFDLAVPHDLISELNLPRPGMIPDPFQSWPHPSNRKFLADKNPDAPQPSAPDNFTQTSTSTWQYGGFAITKNPNELPMDFTHPQMNLGKDLDPLHAIMNGMNFGKEHVHADTSMSLGWPGPHVECPTCVREKAQGDFDMVRTELMHADERDGVWADRVKDLSQELMKVNRARPVAFMPMTLNPTPHPDDPPIIRGPRAEQIMRNTQVPSAGYMQGNGGSASGIPQAMGQERRLEYNAGVSSPSGEPSSVSGIMSPPSVRAQTNLGFGSPSELPYPLGLTSPPDVGSPPSVTGDTFGPPLGPRSRSSTAPVSNFVPRSRSGTNASSNIVARSRGNTADATSSDPRQAIRSALARVNLNAQQSGNTNKQGTQRSVQSPQSGTMTGAGVGNACAGQGFPNVRPQAPVRAVSSALEQGKGRGMARSTFLMSNHQHSASVPDNSGTSSGNAVAGAFAPVAPSTNFKAPNGGRGGRHNRAIPIVNPMTGQHNSGEFQVPDDVQNAAKLASSSDGTQNSTSAGAPSKLGDINVAKTKNFVSKNMFGCLNEDEDSDFPETPGGVRI